MKKLISLLSLLFFAAIILVSCRKDDDESQQPTIVGTWQPTSFKATGVVNGLNVSQTVTANACQLNSRLVFNNNGTGVTKNWNEQNGNCVQEPEENFTYSYNPQTKALTVTTGPDTNTGTITTLTNSQLVYAVQSTFDFNGNNVPATLEITANRAQ